MKRFVQYVRIRRDSASYCGIVLANSSGGQFGDAVCVSVARTNLAAYSLIEISSSIDSASWDFPWQIKTYSCCTAIGSSSASLSSGVRSSEVRQISAAELAAKSFHIDWTYPWHASIAFQLDRTLLSQYSSKQHCKPSQMPPNRLA